MRLPAASHLSPWKHTSSSVGHDDNLCKLATSSHQQHQQKTKDEEGPPWPSSSTRAPPPPQPPKHAPFWLKFCDFQIILLIALLTQVSYCCCCSRQVTGCLRHTSRWQTPAAAAAAVAPLPFSLLDDLLNVRISSPTAIINSPTGDGRTQANRHTVIKTKKRDDDVLSSPRLTRRSLRAMWGSDEHSSKTRVVIRNDNDFALDQNLSRLDEAMAKDATMMNETLASRDIHNGLPNATILADLSNSNATDKLPFSSEAERYVLIANLVLEGVILCAGVIGNGIVIAIILFFTKGNSVADIYIFNLAIADITFVVGLGFLWITSINDHWVFGNIMCKVFMSLTALNQFASSLLLSLMSFDRYLAICHPIFSQRYRHPKPAKLTCLVLWIVCIVLMTPIFIHARTDEDNKTCGIFWPETTTTTSGAISMHSERRTRNRESTNKRVSNLVKAIVATYGVCWLPYWVGQMMIGFSESKDPMTHYTFNQVAACLSYLNSAVNPILYAFLSDSFRRRCSQFWQLLRSFQLFGKGRRAYADQPPINTQTSVTENHHHHQSHQLKNQLRAQLENETNNNNTYFTTNEQLTSNNNSTRQSHTKTTTLTADLELDDNQMQRFLHATSDISGDSVAGASQNRPAESSISNKGDKFIVVVVNNDTNDRESNGRSKSAEQTLQSTARKKSPTNHLVLLRRLKFKRKRKKHSLVKLNQMSSCLTNGDGNAGTGRLMNQTVLLT